MPLKKIGRAIKKTVRKIVPKEVAGIMQVAAPFVAATPAGIPAALALSLGGQLRQGRGRISPLKTLLAIVKYKADLGMPLDTSVNREFEKETKTKNYLFSNGIDLIYELFNLESKLDNNILSKSIKYFGQNSSLNKIFTKIADKGSIL